MTNSLLNKSQLRRIAAQILTGEITVPGYVRPKKEKPEDLTKLTDEALESRIFYSQDARAGEPFFSLFEEYRRRFKELSKK
jgi:hypothetical protein